MGEARAHQPPAMATAPARPGLWPCRRSPRPAQRPGERRANLPGGRGYLLGGQLPAGNNLGGSGRRGRLSCCRQRADAGRKRTTSRSSARRHRV